MNIYILDEDPIKSARQLGDDHLGKVTIDCCQVLANQFTLTELFMEAPRTQSNSPRKHRSDGNPYSKWVANNDNAQWIMEYCSEVLQEYHRRFKHPNSFSAARCFLNWAMTKIKGDSDNHEEFIIKTPSDACCLMHSKFSSSSIIDKHRLFYACDKIFLTWENNAPPWYLDLIETEEVHKLRRERMKQIH